MYRSSFRSTPTTLSVTLLILASCGPDAPTAPAIAPMLSRQTESAAHATQVAICPTTQSYRTEGVIGPRGGTLRAAGHRLTIPPGVLTEPTRFSLHAPAGPHVKLELSAAGAEHYSFRAPVVVTISYDRCTRQHLPASPAFAWYIDETGRQAAERMAGKDDRRRKAVTFRTTHFSTYVVSY